MCSSQRVAAMVAHRRHTWCFAAVVLWLTHCYAHAARCGGLACSNSSIPRVSAPVLLCGEGAADDDPVDMRLFADTAGDVRGLNTPVVSTTTLRAGGAQQVVLALAQVQVSAHLIAVRLDDASPGARARKGGEAAAGSGGWDGKGAAGGAAGAETGGVSRRAGLSDAQYPCSHDVLAWPPVELVGRQQLAAWRATKAVCFNVPLAPGNGMVYAVCGSDAGVDGDTKHAIIFALRGDSDGSAVPVPAWNSTPGLYTQGVAGAHMLFVPAQDASGRPLLVVPSDAGVFAFDAETGALQWLHTGGVASPLLTGIRGRPTLVALDRSPGIDNTLGARGIDTQTGNVTWVSPKLAAPAYLQISVFPTLVPAADVAAPGTLVAFTPDQDEHRLWGFEVGGTGSWHFSAAGPIRAVYSAAAVTDRVFIKIGPTTTDLTQPHTITVQSLKATTPSSDPIVLPCGEACRGGLALTPEGTIYGVGSFEATSGSTHPATSEFGWPGWVYALQYNADTDSVNYTKWAGRVGEGLPVVTEGGAAMGADGASVLALGPAAHDVGVMLTSVVGQRGTPDFEAFAWRCGPEGGVVVGDAATCEPEGCPLTGRRTALCCHSWLPKCHSDNDEESLPAELCVAHAGPEPPPTCAAPHSSSGSGSGSGPHSGGDDDGSGPTEPIDDDGSGTGPDAVQWKTIAIAAAGAFILVGLVVTYMLHRRSKKSREVPLLSIAEDTEGQTYIRL